MASQVTLDDLASPAYRVQLAGLHAAASWGGAGKSHAPEVAAFAAELGARTVLDYGCGRATLGPALSGLDVAAYDPGVPGLDALPEPADLVVCTDVLEHVEPARLDKVLAHILGLARRGVYAVIGLGPARQVLPDGRNAHLMAESADWWISRLERAGWRPERFERRKGLNLWLRT